MKITECDFTAFDLESTGLDVANDRIVEVGVSMFSAGTFRVRGGRIVDPGVPIDPEAAAVHKITDAMVAGRDKFEDIASRLASGFEKADMLVGYNCLSFDVPFLDNEFERAGSDWRMPVERVLDIQTWVNWHHRDQRVRKQEVIAPQFYDVHFDGAAHRASADTQVSGELLLAMVRAGVVEDDVQAALAWQAERRDVIEKEFEDWGPWLYRDRATRRFRIGAGKHCGKLLSDVPKTSYNWYLNNIDDLPAPARAAFEAAAAGRTQDEIQETLLSIESSDQNMGYDEIAGWGG